MMGLRGSSWSLLVLLPLWAAACGEREEPSLRDSLAALPRDTAPREAAAEVDTAGAGPASVPFVLPVDTPAIDEAIGAPESAPAEWTAGVVSVRRAQAGVAQLTSIRAARHDGFDRIVIEFAGSNLPDYHLEYVDRPIRQCGSGDVVSIPGDGWLAIRLEPARAHDDEGRATIENRQIRPDLPGIMEMRLVCDFEAQVEWVLGVRSPNPYRVLELHEPMRLVVDIRR